MHFSWTVKWWSWGKMVAHKADVLLQQDSRGGRLFASIDKILSLSGETCQRGRCIRRCLCSSMTFLGCFGKGSGKLSYVFRGLGYVYLISYTMYFWCVFLHNHSALSTEHSWHFPPQQGKTFINRSFSMQWARKLHSRVICLKLL